VIKLIKNKLCIILLKVHGIGKLNKTSSNITSCLF